MNRWSRLVLVTTFTACAACGGSSASPGGGASSDGGAFPAAPLMMVTSTSGALAIEVRTSPEQPPTRGESTVQLVITDATTSAPRSGLTLDTVPWMPAMGHGASTTPNVVETNPGVYEIRSLELFMPGKWELRTNISGAITDHATPSFQIP